MTEEIVSYGVLSLIPAILAVVLAFWTKNVIISLMASLFVGCLITAGWNPWNAMQVMFSDHLFVDMTGSSNAATVVSSRMTMTMPMVAQMVSRVFWLMR